MKLHLLALSCLALPFAASGAGDDTDLPCFLLDGDKAEKPFPSLTQCYKQNQQACCVSAHDETIANAYGSILSGTCVREYPALEQYYCLGCSPDADSFINYYHNISDNVPSDLGPGSYKQYKKYMGPNVTRTQLTAQDKAAPTTWSSPYAKVSGRFGEIKLCSSFAKKLLYQEGSDETNGIDAYDKCGIMDSGTDMGVLSRTFFALTEDEMVNGEGKLVLPGSWMKMTPEWKFFNTMRPPYFGAADFEISWGNAAPGENSNESPTCFGAASGLQVGSAAVALVALVAQMLA